MKNNQKIITMLNNILSHELTAMDIYFLHSRIYQDMGLEALHVRINHEMQDETLHASMLMERILFLEGIPKLDKRVSYTLSMNVEEMIKVELQYEYDVCKLLKDGIATSEEEKDFVTREILLRLLKDTEEDHINWLEIQLKLIKSIGIERYLQSSIEDKK